MKFRIFIFQVLHFLTIFVFIGCFIYCVQCIQIDIWFGYIVLFMAFYGAYSILDRIERSIYKYILKLKQKQKQIQSINELQRLTKL